MITLSTKPLFFLDILVVIPNKEIVYLSLYLSDFAKEASVLNHSTVEFRDFSKRAPGS